MDTTFDIETEYKKDRALVNVNKVMYKGILILLIAAVIDWELFQWLFKGLQVTH